MKRALLFVFLLVAALAILVGPILATGGCQKGATYPSDADASYTPDASTVAAACAKLVALGCPLGSNPRCPAVFSLDPRFGASPECVLSATAATLSTCHVTCE